MFSCSYHLVSLKLENPKKRLLFIHLSILAIIAVLTRFLILRIITSIYFVDAYTYLGEALAISKGGIIPFGRGFPFIYLLGYFIKLFSAVLTTLDATELLLVIINLFLILAIYKCLTSIMSETAALFSTIFCMFEISFLVYSLVPYLEMFALLTSWVSLLFIFNYFKTSKTIYLLSGLVFSIVSGFTRTEMFFLVGFPIFVVVVCKNLLSERRRDKQIGLLLLGSVTAFLLAFWNYFVSYYFSLTRFDPITKFVMGLRSDVLFNIFNSVLSITQIPSLDFFYKLLFVAAVIFIVSSVLLSLTKKSWKSLKSKIWPWAKNIFVQPQKTSVLTYFLLILAEIVYLIAFGYSYTINGNVIQISVSPLSSRTLIYAQMLVAPVCVYFTLNVSRVRIKRIRTKIHIPRRLSGTHIRVGAIITVCLLLIYLPNMWFVASTTIKNNSDEMDLYTKTAEWLATELPSNQSALLPLPQISIPTSLSWKTELQDTRLFGKTQGLP